MPKEGVNIRLYFPSQISYQRIVTKMARELDIDFSIVWGKLEKLNDNVVGSLVINANMDLAKKIEAYLQQTAQVSWEVI